MTFGEIEGAVVPHVGAVGRGVDGGSPLVSCPTMSGNLLALSDNPGRDYVPTHVPPRTAAPQGKQGVRPGWGDRFPAFV